jgi:hypothetical protein
MELHMLGQRWLRLCILLMPLTASGNEVQTGAAGMQTAVMFSEYSPLSRTAEIVRRMLSPLNAARLFQISKQAGKALREQPIDLANEKFAVYVPAHMPPQGYALLVFVPPWDDAAVPPQWVSTLDRHGMIMVSAAKSGNAANVIDRREPLALLAAQNILNLYPVDPARIYIGGFSGGSRVALRIALGYPDVFHGAFLNAGSDPIGDAHIPLPPAELFRQFQESTRLVYVTGERDAVRDNEDVSSQQSLQKWCVFNRTNATYAFRGHELPDAAAFDRALDALVKPARPDANKLSECRAHIDRELHSRLQQVEDLSAGGKLDDARRLLDRIDAQYAGLAAPRSIELANRWMRLTPATD